MPAVFRLEGSSMLPVFKPGELALVSKAGPRCEARPFLRPGDCAVYSYKGSTLLHRVTRTVSCGAWFSDDAGRLKPHFVPWEDIRGRALGRHPLAGGFRGLVYSKLRRVLRLSLIRRLSLAARLNLGPRGRLDV
jgi:hypothetical protein